MHFRKEFKINTRWLWGKGGVYVIWYTCMCTLNNIQVYETKMLNAIHENYTIYFKL